MKILFFIESLRSGGKERRLVELIKGFSENPNIEMEIVLTKKEIHYEDIFSANIKIHYTVRKGLKKDPRIFYKFYKIAKKVRPDIIHVWGNLVAIYAIPSKVFLRIPMINNQIAGAPSKVSTSILSHRLSFPFSDRIIANSYAGLEAYNAPSEKSTVIYNGFDFTRVNNLKDENEIREKFNIKTKYVVGMVASFSKMKDYATYIKAANSVLEKISDVTFLCIGSGDDIEYKKMVKTENNNRILFLGKQSNVESIMNVCDIGVLTTYTEGISNALLEFMSLKKPVIVTGGGGCIELIEDKKNGFILNVGNDQQLATHLIQLLSNNIELNELGNKSFEIVKGKFAITTMLENFNNEYEQISQK